MTKKKKKGISNLASQKGVCFQRKWCSSDAGEDRAGYMVDPSAPELARKNRNAQGKLTSSEVFLKIDLVP